jgi:hypothetical protein
VYVQCTGSEVRRRDREKDCCWSRSRRRVRWCRPRAKDILFGLIEMSTESNTKSVAMRLTIRDLGRATHECGMSHLTVPSSLLWARKAQNFNGHGDLWAGLSQISMAFLPAQQPRLLQDLYGEHDSDSECHPVRGRDMLTRRQPSELDCAPATSQALLRTRTLVTRKFILPVVDVSGSWSHKEGSSQLF